MTERSDGTAFGSVRTLSASVLSLGRIRLELLAIEEQEEKERIARMLVWAVVSSFLGCFALVFVAVFATALLWDTPWRLATLGAVSALLVGLAVFGVLQLRRLWRAGSTLFEASIGELRADARALDPTPRP